MSARHISGAGEVQGWAVHGPLKCTPGWSSERRGDLVQSLSTVGVRNLGGSDSSAEGPGWTNRWCICSVAIEHCRVTTLGRDGALKACERETHHKDGISLGPWKMTTLMGYSCKGSENNVVG